VQHGVASRRLAVRLHAVHAGSVANLSLNKEVRMDEVTKKKLMRLTDAAINALDALEEARVECLDELTEKHPEEWFDNEGADEVGLLEDCQNLCDSSELSDFYNDLKKLGV